jgi:sugar lactone lactonase YvrE
VNWQTIFRSGSWLLAWFAMTRSGGVQVPPLPQKLDPYPVVANVSFPEGPAFDSQGVFYFVNYIRNGAIGRMTPAGAVGIWFELPQIRQPDGHPGAAFPTGLKVDAGGNVLIADLRGQRLVRISPAREMTILVDHFEGKPINGPNDLCLDRAGNIYFTDPTGSSREKPTGVIYRFSAQGKVTKIQDGLAYPNGIVIDPTRNKLYVDETATNRVLVFDLAQDGTLFNKHVLYQFPTDSVDGLSVDEFSRVWVARLQNGTVDVLSPEGGLLASYPLGDRVTNMAWWDKSLYITVAGQHLIYRCRMGFDGAK